MLELTIKVKLQSRFSALNKLKPEVISIDIAFPEYTGHEDDLKLMSSLENCVKLVMASEMFSLGTDYTGKDLVSIALSSSIEFFPIHAKAGFVSTTQEQNRQQIPKRVIVQETSNGYTYYHFSVRTAMAFDSLRAKNFIENYGRSVNVEYKNGDRKFKVFTAEEVLGGQMTQGEIEGKIVMLGFLGPGDTDKFFSPLNKDSKQPDMYGLQYLANIVAQVLEFDTK